jgi:hypothetical protein
MNTLWVRKQANLGDSVATLRLEQAIGLQHPFLSHQHHHPHCFACPPDTAGTTVVLNDQQKELAWRLMFTALSSSDTRSLDSNSINRNSSFFDSLPTMLSQASPVGDTSQERALSTAAIAAVCTICLSITGKGATPGTHSITTFVVL